MIRTSQIGFLFVTLFFVLTISCKDANKKETLLQQTLITDCGCDSLWSKPAASDFVETLEKTTSSSQPVWKDYNLGDPYFVLNAGKLSDTTFCLGLWNKGKVVSYSCSKDIPKMLTPLYSYYLNYKNTTQVDSTYFGTYKNAPEFSSWMETYNVETAVYIPTEFPKFPFKIPAKTKTQLAIHEAFHIEVMLRYWYTETGYWPKWDIQPDRAGMQNCYNLNESTQKLIVEEQNTLAFLIEALLDDKKQEAVDIGMLFLKKRETRYNMLNEIKIQLDGDVFGDCKVAEAIMEIEEGIADYASWTKMYDIGVVSRADLLQRYQARQNDRFYLTGCMLFHACVLMNNNNDLEIIEKMVEAVSLEHGNLTTLFSEQLAIYSQQ